MDAALANTIIDLLDPSKIAVEELKENIEPRIDKKAIAVAFLDGRLQAFSDKHNTINKIRIRRIDITPIDASYSVKIKRWCI